MVFLLLLVSGKAKNGTKKVLDKSLKVWYTLITEREVTKMEKFIKEYAEYIKTANAGDEVLSDKAQRVVRLRYRGVISTNECMRELAKLACGQ